jgi:hypothetical protein
MTDLNLKTVPVIREAGHGEETGYLFSFGAYGNTHVAVIGGSLESGLESCLEWLDDNAPGLLHTVSAADYAEAARELGVAWEPEEQANADTERVVQHAEADMTMVGHTTLKHGNCIPSYEWFVRELDAEELATLMRRFCQNCESELDAAKECILCGECHASLVSDVTHDLLIERGPVQPEPSPEEIAERGEDENDPDATDVRLQVRTWRGNDWGIRTGDSSYDQDHRGFWGAGRISPYDTDHCIGETANDLVDQALEQAATSEEI